MIRYQPGPGRTAITCHARIRDAMADAMREMDGSGQTVSVETLQQRGFTTAAIERFSDAAVQQARRQSVRHVEAG